jgi:hypothetical protein
MATSPNYAWAEPDNSSLVKNGAQDIRALGDAIDTSVWNVGYGQAGKNKLINGDFKINQRNFTSITANGDYGFDRFLQILSGGTVTSTPQVFTAGAAPVAPYEATNYWQMVTSGQSAASDRALVAQRIEDVRSLAGQTITVSFWAKANSGTPKMAVEVAQYFGLGGSPSAIVNTYVGQVTLSTSWARYSVTAAIPSISGKTIGTTAGSSYVQVNLYTSAGTDFNARTGSIGVQNNTFGIWGVQLEYGSYATPFQTATGTIQGELSACQRYYFRAQSTGGYKVLGSGYAGNTTTLNLGVILPSQMRVIPTSLETSAMASFYYESSSGGTTPTSIGLSSQSTENIGSATVTKSGAFTAGYAYWLFSNNTAAYLGFSAEL